MTAHKEKGMVKSLSLVQLPEVNNQLHQRRATHAFLLCAAYSRMYPDRSLNLDYSFGDAFFCHDCDDIPITSDDCKQLASMIESDLLDDVPIELCEMPKKDVVEYFLHKGYNEKIPIVNTWPSTVPVIRHGPDWDIRVEEMCVEKDFIMECAFEVMSYNKGLLLRFPLLSRPEEVLPFVDHPEFFKILEDHNDWGRLMEVDYVSALNQKVYTGRAMDIIHVAEGFHMKHLVKIADDISSKFPQKRIICIAGPSSSGKTTFARKLAVQLKCNGYDSIHIALDDYYRDRDEIPLEEDGTRNFERITALNLDILCHHLQQYINGQVVTPRKFSFKDGKGYFVTDPAKAKKLGPREYVILEGIHGLNPVFADKVGKDKISTIYVSALTQLNIDRHHRIPSSDCRLIRRMVRDWKYRGYSALDTLTRWPQVRKAEHEFIFPFQHTADYVFNTALVYELCVLSQYARPLLVELMNMKGLSEALVPEVERLYTMLNFVYPIPEHVVPSTSLLREFVGGGDFDKEVHGI